MLRVKNVEKFKLLIKSCWVVLFGIWLFTLVTGKYLSLICKEENILKVCNIIESRWYLILPLQFAIYYLQSVLVLYTILKRKIFSYRPIVISIYILAMWIIKYFTQDYDFSSYLDFVLILFAIILDHKKWLRAIIGTSLIFVFTLISLVIKQMANVNIADTPLVIQIILMIDILIMCFIYYIYSRKEGEENETYRFIFQIKEKVENCVSRCRKCFCSRRNRSNSSSNDRSNLVSFYDYYCSIIFAIITYGSIFLVSYLFDKVIETTFSIIFFHIFRRKDEKTFHANNDIMCFITSVSTFTIIVLLQLSLEQSILFSLCLAYILTNIMFYVKDYIDYLYEKNQEKKSKPLNIFSLDELKHNFGNILDENTLEAVYSYLHKGTYEKAEDIAYKYSMSRSTLFRSVKQIKKVYKG